MGLIILDRLICNLLSPIFTNDPQVFWTSIGSIGSIGVVFFALNEVWKNAQLGNDKFENAINVDLSQGGIFKLVNISDHSITINTIKQQLITDSELTNNFGESMSLRSGSYEQNANKINSFLLRYFKKHSKAKYTHTINIQRSIAPSIGLVIANSLTHLPTGYETQVIWIVRTSIKYSSPNGKKSEVKNFTHRFSVDLEPRT